MGTSSKLPAVPIGWVAMPLFDHKDLLASGMFSLRLWGGAEANPIGPPTANISVDGMDTPVLYVQFDTFAQPLMIPQVLRMFDVGCCKMWDVGCRMYDVGCCRMWDGCVDPSGHMPYPM